MTLNDATRRQIEAADPAGNTWLSANAGSGKTRVLTDRVARLLLRDVQPQNILCLTYTKAAANEMQNRLFKRLGAWAMLDDTTLRGALAELGAGGQADLAKARRLFARAIETPGGLKIQTIHAFCASILRRFPMEAGVSPDFQEMDDRAIERLQADIVEEMADGAHRTLLEGLARHYTGTAFEDLTKNIIGKREAFTSARSAADIWQMFELPEGFQRTDQIAATIAPGDADLINTLRPLLAAGSKTEVSAADKLSHLSNEPFTLDDIGILESVFLTGKSAKIPFSAKIGSFPTKGLRDGAAAPLMDRLEGLMARVEDNRQSRLALLPAERTLALHNFAHPFVRAYEDRKAQRGWLDFDDLIQKTRQLLQTSAVAQWVLFRLDGGIDHILVDEAQDTSPTQWAVIDSLAREFMSGEGAHAGKDWSFFVVGDPKQSIYSFQGADPVEFARMRAEFSDGLNQVQRPLRELPLAHSFRSAPAILEAVDKTLHDVDGLGETPDHIAFHEDRAGRVDLWPALEPVKEDEPRPWNDPVDVPAPTNHLVQLADAIGEELDRMIRQEQIPDRETGAFRNVTAGDILILVQRRSELFHQIIRACKARGLPIAGADRLRIGGEMAVKDLAALLAFLGTPEDDLSLAAVLRSPLGGLDEDDLFRLAHGRKGTLWRALRDSKHAVVIDMLEDLRAQADFLRPYDLIDRTLTRHDGRRKLIGRLGAEAEDGIDSMLAQALAYERNEVPSLTGFLTWLDTEDVEIKRQMEADAAEIRVMTVHGAKGLESPIVFLPDAAQRKPRGAAELLDLDGSVAWTPKSDLMPTLLRSQADQARIREDEERMRLLYVAMTRAESWLVVAAAGEMGKEAAQSWHGLVGQGLSGLDAVSLNTPTGATGLRYQRGDWPAPKDHAVVGEARREPDPPDWTERLAPTPPPAPKVLVPSDLPGAKALAGPVDATDDDDPLRRGRQIHTLLEVLPAYPRAEWSQIAQTLLSAGEDAATGDALADLVAEATAVLTSPDLAPLFNDTALAEVGISGPTDVAGAVRIQGIIDRLVVAEDHVLAIDFKSNRTIPTQPADIPDGILAQLGAYESVLTQLYPDKEIRSAVLWTRSATLMNVPPGVALRTFRRLDGTKPDT